jgi:hypothetical protein
VLCAYKPPRVAERPTPSCVGAYVVPVCSPSEDHLKLYITALREFLLAHPDTPLLDVCGTMALRCVTRVSASTHLDASIAGLVRESV